MKIEKLNDNKLKITLDINDLKSRNIDARSFMHNTPESQDLFWDAIQEAESKYGFSVEESMIYVEAHMSSSGIFTIIVTKQNQTMQSINSPANKSKLGRNSSFKLKRKTSDYSLDNSIYKFNNLEDLYAFCKVVNTSDITDNALYVYNNKYYLYVDKINNFLIIEYATKEQEKELLLSKLKEYGTMLFKKNAIAQIKKMI